MCQRHVSCVDATLFCSINPTTGGPGAIVFNVVTGIGGNRMLGTSAFPRIVKHLKFRVLWRIVYTSYVL